MIIVVNRNLKDVMRCCIDALHVHILQQNDCTNEQRVEDRVTRTVGNQL